MKMKIKELDKIIDNVCKVNKDDKKAVKILMDSLHDYMWDDRKNEYSEKRLKEVKSISLELLNELRNQRTYNNTLKWKYKGTVVLKDGTRLGEKSTGYEGDGGIDVFENEFLKNLEKHFDKTDIEHIEGTKVYY